jgi:DNA replication protein DnaC
MKNDEVTAWIDTLFFKIIDYRYNKKLPTVWITRLKGLEAMSMYDNASISRITETSIMIKMGDKKYRSKRAMKNESYNL